VLGSSWPGEEKLLALVRQGDFEEALKPTAAAVLFNVYRRKIQLEAAEYLPKPAVKGEKLPPIKQLLASAGNRNKGHLVFQRYCKTCHQIKGEGVSFGPELTSIGEKLSKEGLYRSILYPDEGVSFGYETTLVKLKDGTESMGIIASETQEGIKLNLPGGASVNYEKQKVLQMEKHSSSLMPQLGPAMSEQELVDLVEYLAAMKDS
jgi:putative heme-binding domain-containing protein